MNMARHVSPDRSPSPRERGEREAPTSKRDQRRNRIMDKLQGMIDRFQDNQHAHYRAQLQALQVDMTMILRAEPYGIGAEGAGMLEDSGEEIRGMIESMAANLPNDEKAQSDYHALAGSFYRQFVGQVNKCIEDRDADLTRLHDHHESAVKELDRLTQHKLHQANEEHKGLTNAIRQRLIGTLKKKQSSLLKDKEQLDIGDSNALLLHPNHFSINTPGSPPNGLQNRKTRHLRHRQGSPNAGDLDMNGKKKRKAGAMEDDGNESPAPTSFLHPGMDAARGRSPFREARDRNSYIQYEAPAYSLERLFTEKELAHATDTAKVATWKYFNQPPEEREQETNGNGTAVPSIDEDAMETAEDDEAVPGVAQTTEHPDGTPPPSEPAAAEMERSTSHQVLTRGGARANPLAALSDLAAVAANERDAAALDLTARKDPFQPVLHSYHATNRSEKSGAPAPSGVSHLDMDNDFALMRQAASRFATGAQDVAVTDNHAANNTHDDVDPEEEEVANTLRNQLLDQALGQTGVRAPYRLPLTEHLPAQIGKGVDRIPGTGFAPVMSFEQKVRQQVPPVAGAMAMALRAGAGGEAMSRTTSAGGVSEDNVGEVLPRRGRGRQMV